MSLDAREEFREAWDRLIKAGLGWGSWSWADVLSDLHTCQREAWILLRNAQEGEALEAKEEATYQDEP